MDSLRNCPGSFSYGPLEGYKLRFAGMEMIVPFFSCQCGRIISNNYLFPFHPASDTELHLDLPSVYRINKSGVGSDNIRFL